MNDRRKYLQISKKTSTLAYSGADLCWALGGIICNFTPIFNIKGGWTSTMILFGCGNLVKTKKKMQMKHFFSPNLGEDQKNGLQQE